MVNLLLPIKLYILIDWFYLFVCVCVCLICLFNGRFVHACFHSSSLNISGELWKSRLVNEFSAPVDYTIPDISMEREMVEFS